MEKTLKIISSQYNLDNVFFIINFRQVASITSLVQPLGVSVAGGVPTYSFDTAQKSTFYTDNGLLSRWQGQVGLRYRF